MYTNNTHINLPLEALFGISKEALFVLELGTAEVLAMSPCFETLENYYTTIIKYWNDEHKDYLIHPDDRAKRAAFTRELAEADGDELRKLDFRVLNPEGSWERLSICFMLIKRDPAEFPSLALGSLTPAKESKPADRSYDEMGLKELSEKEEEYKILLAATADVIWKYDATTNISKASLLSKKVTLPEIEQGEKLWIDAVHKDDWEHATTLWLKANVEKKSYAFRVRIKVQGDTYKWVDSRGVPILNAEGDIKKWIGTLTDIHEQVLAEKATAQKLQQLQLENERLQKQNAPVDSLCPVVNDRPTSVNKAADHRDAATST